MTILDTFFIEFKNRGLVDAQNDVKQFDKQITELAAKGNKRNKDEQEQLKLLRKQRLDATLDLKDQIRTTDLLGESFGGLATKILGVGAALFGLNSLKNGVLSAVNKNTHISNQAFVSGQNPNDLRALAAIVEAGGGSGEGAISLIDSMRKAANARGIAFTNVFGLLNAANKEVQNRPKAEQARILEQLYGINDEALERQLEGTVESWRKIVELKKQSTLLTKDDWDTAKEFTAELGMMNQSWEKFYTKLGTATFPALDVLLSYVNHILDGLEAIIKLPGVFYEGGQGIGNYIKGANSNGRLFGSNRGGPSASGITWPGTSSTSPKTGNAAIDFWLSQGYTLNGAIGMAANEQAESSGNPNARNGKHYGLYQFDEKRRTDALAALGIDVATASADDQRIAAAWDAHRRGNDSLINSGTSPGGSAAIANSYFEVSGESPENRIRIANQIASQFSSGGKGSGATGDFSVKIDNVNINTPTSDPNQHAKLFSETLAIHLDDLRGDWDDGRDR